IRFPYDLSGQHRTSIIPDFPTCSQNFLGKIIKRPAITATLTIDYNLMPGPENSALMQVVCRKILRQYHAIHVPKRMNIVIPAIFTLKTFGSNLVKQY